MKDSDRRPTRLGIVLEVTEDDCVVSTEGVTREVPFATVFPRPRTERVFPGHPVAIAATTDGREAIIWRWFDAVVLGPGGPGEDVRLWERGHGEVSARVRPGAAPVTAGDRVHASSGLPGAEWWIAGAATQPELLEVGEVEALYVEAGLWPRVFPPG